MSAGRHWEPRAKLRSLSLVCIGSEMGTNPVKHRNKMMKPLLIPSRRAVSAGGISDKSIKPANMHGVTLEIYIFNSLYE